MRFYKSFLIFGLIAFASLATALQFPGNNVYSSLNHINYQLPHASLWQLENKISDRSGYAEVYKADFAGATHRITLNFGRNITTPLLDSMQEVLQSHTSTNCQIQQSKILKREKNSLTFSTILANCPNNIKLIQIYKVFNMSDGQYSIMYATDNPNPTDPSFMRQLKNMVESATIE